MSRETWEAVAGVVFARRTRPERLTKGVLMVLVATPSWAQELSLAAPTIVERLRARGVEVEEIRYRVGAVDAPDRGGVLAPSAQERARASSVKAPEQALAPLAAVSDGKLRDVLARTAEAIARRDAKLAVEEKAKNPERTLPKVPGKRAP